MVQKPQLYGQGQCLLKELCGTTLPGGRIPGCRRTPSKHAIWSSGSISPWLSEVDFALRFFPAWSGSRKPHGAQRTGPMQLREGKIAARKKLDPLPPFCKPDGRLQSMTAKGCRYSKKQRVMPRSLTRDPHRRMDPDYSLYFPLCKSKARSSESEVLRALENRGI